MNEESEEKQQHKKHTHLYSIKLLLVSFVGLNTRKNKRDHVPLWLCFGVKDSCKYSTVLFFCCYFLHKLSFSFVVKTANVKFINY